MGRALEAAAAVERKNQQADSLAEKVVRETVEKFAAVESLLFSAAERNATINDFSPDEWLLFRSLNIDAHKLRMELDRCREVLRWRRQAGTPSQREAIRQRLAAARARLAGEGTEIRSELERLTAELGGKLKSLENEVAAAELENQRIDKAVEFLRSNVPAHLATAAEISIERIRRPYFEKLSALRTKIQQAETFGKLDFRFENDRQQAIRAAKEFCPAAVHEGDASFLNFEIWQKYVSGLTAELPALEAEAEQCSTEMRLAIESAKFSLLDRYLAE